MIKYTVSQLRNVLSFIEVKKCRYLKKCPTSLLFLLLWVTNRCNLQCKMCGQWKAEGEDISQELSTRQWCDIIDSAVKMKTAVISITGGEPFLREDIFEIIDYIKKRKIASHICTNGTMFNEDVIKRLKKSPPNSISISLDSDKAEIHNDLRGVDCFDTVVRGINLLKRNIPESNIGINYLITRRNFYNMDRMVFFAEKLGVNQIKFAPLHSNLMYKCKRLSGFDSLFFTKQQLSEVQSEIYKLIRALSKTKLYTNSRSFLKGLFNLHTGQYEKINCYAGYVSCAVSPLGRVSPCYGIEGIESVRNKLLPQIWQSDGFGQLRKQAGICGSNCWDTTNTELNIRCSTKGFIRDFFQILKDIRFYLKKHRSI